MFFYTPIQPLQDILTLNTVKRYGGNYGNVRLWGSIGFAIICLLIGMYTDRYGIQQLVFVFITISLATLISSLFLEESKPESEARFINVQDVVSLFRNKRFLFFLIFTFIVVMPSRIVDSFLGIHIKSLGGSDTLVGTASMIAALSEVPFFIIVGILLKRINPLYLILIGSSFYLIRALCVSLITQPEHILYMQFLFGVAFTFIFVASMSYVMSIVSNHVKGTALSIFFAIFWGLTGIVGNIVGGMVLDQFDSKAVFIACASIIMLGMILGFWLKRDKFVTA
jgi:PPP family 3-phenylpropionic acid transporter